MSLPTITRAGVDVLDARTEVPDIATRGWPYGRARELVNGIAIHHDAVAFSDVDRNFNGSTLDEQLDRIKASYRWHTQTNGWGGIGYHLYVFPGRIFQVGDMDSTRAHVHSMNSRLDGIVLAGDFSRRKPDGALLLTAGLAVLWTWAWRGRLLDIKGHEEWAMIGSPPGYGSSCPGGGTTSRSWVGDLAVIARKVVEERQRPVDPNLVMRSALGPAWERGDWATIHKQLHYVGVPA